jgi:hypothetical protein
MQAVGSAFRWLLAALVARPGWGTVAGLCALACALLLPFDRDLQAWLAGWQKAPGIGDVLAVVRCFGRGEVAVLVALAVAASGRWRLGAQMLLALAICAVLTWAFKLGVLRERPTGRSFSFVSGDTSTAWALVPLLARSWPVIAGCALVAAGVGLPLAGGCPGRDGGRHPFRIARKARLAGTAMAVAASATALAGPGGHRLAGCLRVGGGQSQGRLAAHLPAGLGTGHPWLDLVAVAAAACAPDVDPGSMGHARPRRRPGPPADSGRHRLDPVGSRRAA